MKARPEVFVFVGAIKVDPGPIPDLKPPKQEIAAQLPERIILSLIIFLAFSVLILGRVFYRPKVALPEPPEHPASAARRVLSQIPSDAASGVAAAAVAHAMRNYLRAAFGLGEEELTTLELANRFGSHRLANVETATKVQEFLRSCDAVQFAPGADSPAESIIARALPLIEELEHQRIPPAILPPPLPAAT